MKRVFYIPDEKKELIKQAEKVFSEGNISNVILRFDSFNNESISSAVVRFLEGIVQEYNEREKGYEIYEILDGSRPVRLIGKKLASYTGYVEKVESQSGDIKFNLQNWNEGKNPDGYFIFTAYQTKNKRLFVEIKRVKKNKEYFTYLEEIFDLWVSTKMPTIKAYGFESVWGFLQLPEKLLNEIIKSLDIEIEDYLIID